MWTLFDYSSLSRHLCLYWISTPIRKIERTIFMMQNCVGIAYWMLKLYVELVVCMINPHTLDAVDYMCK
jgi:hypothetical protein